MIGDSTHRRGFLGRAVAGVVGALSVPRLLEATSETMQGGDPDAWLAKLTAPHRCLFDAPQHGSGLPQIHVYNYINTYQQAYKVPSTSINTVFTCYGPPGPATMPIAWNDAMWAKYKVGEQIGLKDSGGKFVTNNVFFRAKAGDPVLGNGAFAVAGLEGLQKLGTTVLMCNNAFMMWVGHLAGKGLGTAADIEKDIRANLVPGTVTVPAMVIAIEKAQSKGVAYNRQG